MVYHHLASARGSLEKYRNQKKNEKKNRHSPIASVSRPKPRIDPTTPRTGRIHIGGGEGGGRGTRSLRMLMLSYSGICWVAFVSGLLRAAGWSEYGRGAVVCCRMWCGAVRCGRYSGSSVSPIVGSGECEVEGLYARVANKKHTR